MYFKIMSGGVLNIEGQLCDVEVDMVNALPGISMVGSLASEVREAGERVRSAIRNSGYFISPGRITVSLSPADVRKEGTGYDLPIALGILLASQAVEYCEEGIMFLNRTLFIGELGLDGSLRRIKGVLPVLIKAKQLGITSFVIPKGNLQEASVLDGIDVIGCESLQEVIEVLQGRNSGVRGGEYCFEKVQENSIDISEVHGNYQAKRGMLVAASGNHNLLLMGVPGAGKSMLANCVRDILPKPSEKEILEIASVASIMGVWTPQTHGVRPFRCPHHTITLQAFTGGGVYPKPGELTMAHRGVLFLDELPEFKEDVLESLREPLANQIINVVRSRGAYTFPSDFLMISAMNNCRCGFYPDRNRCKCSEREIARYQGKISGPLLDRIDLFVPVNKVSMDEMERSESVIAGATNVTTEEMRRTVCKMRELQQERFKGTKVEVNGRMTNEQVKKYCGLSKSSEKLLKDAYDYMNLSMRTYYKVLKVARTIADIEGKDLIEDGHIAEALGYRNRIIGRA